MDFAILEINEDKIPDWNRAELHINVIEKSKDMKIDASQMLRKIFAPGIELGRRYIRSWQDGTQAQFLNRFSHSMIQGDGLVLAKRSLLRMVEIWKRDRNE
ncbi:hypothetical protein K7432_018160 [Basidiobolus ranarum]|uniref:Uncharacterized protein n=1 Tax=Basidiobolus ranarum TaxID=34480 RepID=A0ABR2WCI0_9FUNG